MECLTVLVTMLPEIDSLLLRWYTMAINHTSYIYIFIWDSHGVFFFVTIKLQTERALPFFVLSCWQFYINVNIQ